MVGSHPIGDREVPLNHETTTVFQVLYVCRANQCRSAIAQVLLGDALATTSMSERVEWSVASAGVSTSPGTHIHPTAMAELLARGHRGPVVDTFAGSPLTRAAVVGADLILTAERAHRSAVVLLDPTALRRTFTMRQFARLTSPASTEGMGAFTRSAGLALVSAALASRGGSQPVDPADDDIPDPVGGRATVFRRCYAQIESTLSAFGLAVPEEVAAGRLRWWKAAR